MVSLYTIVNPLFHFWSLPVITFHCKTSEVTHQDRTGCCTVSPAAKSRDSSLRRRKDRRTPSSYCVWLRHTTQGTVSTLSTVTTGRQLHVTENTTSILAVNKVIQPSKSHITCQQHCRCFIEMLINLHRDTCMSKSCF